VISDPDQRAEPAGVAEGHSGHVEQRHPGLAANGCTTPRGQAVGEGQIQLTAHLHHLDLPAATGHGWPSDTIGVNRDRMSAPRRLDRKVRAAAVGAQPVQRHHIHRDDHQRPERVW
jgi:hypothetical protein